MNSNPPSEAVFSGIGRRAGPPAITKLMQVALETPGLLSLAAGFTDNSSLPVTFISEAVRALGASANDAEHLQYGTNAGRPALRMALAARLAGQDAPSVTTPDQSRITGLRDATFMTNGSQQALYLAIQTLCEPGDIVLVDRPSYFVFMELLRGLGVEARSMPVDKDENLDLPALKSQLNALIARGERERLKAVYFVSYFSNPSGRTLTTEEKQGLAATLRETGCVIPVMEDAAYRELGFDPASANAVPGILGDEVWEGFPLLYTGTLTKPFATGLKVGYGVCPDTRWRSAMLHVKGHHDFGSGNFAQAILEHALLTGALDQQLSVLRRIYSKKRDALHATLISAGLADLGWSWRLPQGGLYLWLKGPAGLDTGFDSTFCRACLAEGVLYVPGELCFGDNPPGNTVRLSYGVLSPEALAEAGARFVRAARKING